MHREYVVYHGTEFDIEWFFDERGKSRAQEYFEKLSAVQQKKTLHLLKLMGNQGEILNIEKFRNEGDQIYAFKPSPDRFLCFFWKEAKIIITNAFEKKSEKLPVNEKHKALRYKENYILRVKRGTYYE